MKKDGPDRKAVQLKISNIIEKAGAQPCAVCAGKADAVGSFIPFRSFKLCGRRFRGGPRGGHFKCRSGRHEVADRASGSIVERGPDFPDCSCSPGNHS